MPGSIHAPLITSDGVLTASCWPAGKLATKSDFLSQLSQITSSTNCHRSCSPRSWLWNGYLHRKLTEACLGDQLPWGSEGRRIGKRQTLNHSIVVRKASVNLGGILQSWNGPSELSQIVARGPGLHILMSVCHWKGGSSLQLKVITGSGGSGWGHTQLWVINTVTTKFSSLEGD